MEREFLEIDGHLYGNSRELQYVDSRRRKRQLWLVRKYFEHAATGD